MDSLTPNQILLIIVIILFFFTVMDGSPKITRTCKCDSCIYSVSYFGNMMNNENARKQYVLDK